MPPKKKKNPVLSGDKKERILSAALQVFSNQGYYSTNVSDIANVAEVSQGTIYNYFESKEQIMLEVFKKWEETFFSQSQVEALQSAQSAKEALQAFGSHVAEIFEQTKEFLPIQIELWSQVNHNSVIKSGFKKIFSKQRELIASLLLKGIQEGEFRKLNPEMVATLLISVFDGLIMQYLCDPKKVSWKTLILEWNQIVLEGIVKK